MASIVLNNHDGYPDQEKRGWYARIWLFPFYGAYIFYRQHKERFDDEIGKEAVKELAPETASEAIDRVMDDIDL